MWDIKVVHGDVSPNRIAGEMVPTPSPASRSSARRICRAKNQRVAVWLAPLFWNTGKLVTGRRVGTDTHMVEANRDPEEVLCEALRVPLPYVRETPELGHWHEVLLRYSS
jgi:hypothetical protein